MNDVTANLPVDPDALARFDRAAPRYTSYPTAPNFTKEFGPENWSQALKQASEEPDAPLGLYVHVPFCHVMCTYCACNTWIPSGTAIVDRYLNALEQEFAMVAERLGKRRTLAQMHWGGGTPNYLDDDKTRWLMDLIRSHFTFADGAEVALEVHPSYMSVERTNLYAELGFNRISMGVQDFDPKVEQAIGRPQTVEETRRVIEVARDHGFKGINMDLVYGLPFQTEETLARTLDHVIDLAPDRLATYSFAYVPWVKGHQKQIDIDTCAAGRDKWVLFSMLHNRLVEAGYRPIGMDHFARPDDELARAQSENRLRRTFQGYTVLPAKDILGIGISSISNTAGVWAQNVKSFRGYCQAIEDGHLATERGVACSQDDHIRRHVIEDLMCNFRIDWDRLSKQFNLDVRAHVQASLENLSKNPEGDFITEQDNVLLLKPEGRPFVRNVAMLFDAYLPDQDTGGQDGTPRFSKSI